jgi:starch synthase (maltosyl-transferring)
MKPLEGRKRVVIEEVLPQVDCGRYPAKRILGDRVTVSAAIFGDGHDQVAGRVLYRAAKEKEWQSVSMSPLTNDLWSAEFTVDSIGEWQFAVEGWVDHFGTWAADLRKRIDAVASAANPATAAQDIPLALRSGALLLTKIAERAEAANKAQFAEMSANLEQLAGAKQSVYEYPLTKDFIAEASLYPDPELMARFDRTLTLWVDRELARYSNWYELFPRSTGEDATKHGTLADVQKLLPSISAMGFNILYMPPIHPIGKSFRKGRNNSVTAGPDDPGSPWAIGSSEGGHQAIHSELGTLSDFNNLVTAAKQTGIEIALDIAFQCAPDHPWVAEHPDWFVIRPDGSIQYAENPPKKYQDIYPLNFESPDWRGLWDALRGVFAYWIRQGVTVFRVDNPHTKALPFWEWCIDDLHKKWPEAIFLAEAFTRPHVMYSLAKGGFTQSYTYFTWRTTKADIQEYFEEITKPPVTDYFHPNLWPNTPDILHESLQNGGRPAFIQRLILATTLGANYGIYGPGYELCDGTPVKPGSEEYLDSEKYEIRHWDRSRTDSLTGLITDINKIRKENIALQSDGSLHFHPTENEQILCYSKVSAANRILVAINLDPVNEHGSWIDLDLEPLGLNIDQSFQVEDLLTGTTYQWNGSRNYVALRPETMPAHIFRIS